MIDFSSKVRFKINYTTNFKKNYKKIKKQGKDVEKLKEVISYLANGLELDYKYKNHKLVDDKNYSNCNECHIESDWLLIYQYIDNKLILILVATGSHSDLF